MFTLRRILYALAIVFLADYPLFGVWIVLGGTLCMLIFAMTEMPWRDPLVNNQHIFNELMTYLLCICLLLFNSFVAIQTRTLLGYGLIGLVSVFLVYNGVIMLRKVTRIA